MIVCIYCSFPVLHSKTTQVMFLNRLQQEVQNGSSDDEDEYKPQMKAVFHIRNKRASIDIGDGGSDSD